MRAVSRDKLHWPSAINNVCAMRPLFGNPPPLFLKHVVSVVYNSSVFVEYRQREPFRILFPAALNAQSEGTDRNEEGWKLFDEVFDVHGRMETAAVIPFHHSLVELADFSRLIGFLGYRRDAHTPAVVVYRVCAIFSLYSFQSPPFFAGIIESVFCSMNNFFPQFMNC